MFSSRAFSADFWAKSIDIPTGFDTDHFFKFSAERQCEKPDSAIKVERDFAGSVWQSEFEKFFD